MKVRIHAFIARRRAVLMTIITMAVIAFASAKPQQQEGQPKVTKVYLLHADKAKADDKRLPGVQILIGNVKFRHDSMYMYCDSAHVYEATNSFEAFNHVHMEQGDTLFIDGDHLFYDGQSMIAQMRNNVVMINRNTTLETDSFNFDRVANLGYYFEGGTLYDDKNTLTSFWGQYSPETKIAKFNHDVELVNEQMTLLSDTLVYSTTTKIAEIVGPSDIYNDSSYIYSELGFYNTGTDRAILLNRSIVTSDNKQLTGDSIFYDRQKGYGEAFMNVILTDTIDRHLLLGDYCFYDEKTDYAYATHNAVAIDYSQGDSLYMHADTLKLITRNIDTDSMYRDMLAYRKVRIYRSDVQAICDSLAFSTADSCLQMFYEPVLWHGKQPILGEKIDIFMNDSTIDRIHVIDQTLSVERIDSVCFNQVAGKEMTSYFRDGEMYETWVEGNVYVDYYMFDDDSLMIGMNYTETSELKLFMKDRKMDKIWMPASTGVIYPIAMIPANRLYLSNFAWFDYIRPLNKDDIFHWRPKKAGTELKVSYKHKAPLQSLDDIKKK